MDRREIEDRIASINWYHEFDFPGGLKARSASPHAAGHRTGWEFIRRELDLIDFTDKTVLDIGCWDGMWSFYAEQRGASHVLATDDVSQNWSSGGGVRLARELLGSSIELDQARSVYNLADLDRTFDIILCLGVYYHLHDPFYAFAQIRHCCHENSIVVFEGDATLGLKPNTALIDLSNRFPSIFIPTPHVLGEMLEATFLRPKRQQWLEPMRPGTGPQLKYLKVRDHLNFEAPSHINRLLTVARPFVGENPLHVYPPPFGLSRYDPRYSG
ncbi:MAG: class I SAM-dependent methyltransferase [Phenylobacterium sp.]